MFGTDWTPDMAPVHRVLEQWLDVDDAAASIRERLQLSRNEFHALVIVWRDGPTAMSELSRRIGLSPGAMTSLADRLTDRGLLMRHTDGADRRRYLIAATPAFERQLAERAR